MYYKKPFLILIAFLIVFMPVAPALAQDSGLISETNQQSQSNIQTNTIINESPQKTGDFFGRISEKPLPPAQEVPVQEEAPPAQPKTVEKINDAAPIALSEEEPEPTDDDPPTSPHTYSQDINGTVDNSKINKENGKAQVDSYSGSLSYSYDFNIPPGRNGMQPNINLSYNSQLKNFSNITGLGWELNLIDIHRDFRKTNLQKEENNYNYLIFNFYGNNLKIFPKDLADNYYGEYITENSDFSKIEFIEEEGAYSMFWRVTDKNGTVYTLGKTAFSRVDTPEYEDQPELTYKWMITEIRDTNDNYIRFEYLKDNNQIYPKKIFYTGYNTTDGIFEIRFQPFAAASLEGLERDDISTTYEYRLWRYETVTKYILDEIEVYIDGDKAKKFEIEYTKGANATTSLLSSIQEIGIEGEQEIPLPATTFEYTQKTESFELSDSWKAPNFVGYSPSGNGSYDFGARIIDINGDGLADIIKSGSVSSSYKGETSGVYINNGLTGWYQEFNCNIPAAFVNETMGDPGARAIDLNNDGLTDFIKSYVWGYNPINVEKKVYINKGNCEFEEKTDWDLPFTISDNGESDPNLTFADINGDGLTDVASHSLINNGKNGWLDQSNEWITFSSDSTDSGVRYADVNGDGYVDVLNNDITTYLNSVYGGWEETDKWISPVPFVEPVSGAQPPRNRDNGVRLVDINADGLTDIVNNNSIYINDGVEGFFLSEDWYLPASFVNNEADKGARLMDVNGDNLIDVVTARYVGSYINSVPNPDKIKETYINQGIVPDLLTKVTNGYGGESDFTYTSSAGYLNGVGTTTDLFKNSAYVDKDYNTTHQTGTLRIGKEVNEEKWITYVHPKLDDIPDDAEIVSFLLKLQISNTNAGPDISIEKVTSEWDEETITWNTKPTTGEQLCLRNNFSDLSGYDGTWYFNCKGPLDENGFAIRVSNAETEPPSSPYTSLSNIQILDLVYKAKDPYNPNQNLNSVVTVVEKQETDDGQDNINSFSYEYSEGATATTTGMMNVPATIDQEHTVGGPHSNYNYVSQLFCVDRSGYFDYAKVWMARASGSTHESYNFKIAEAIPTGELGGIYNPGDILAVANIPASSIGIFGQDLQQVEVVFDDPPYLEPSFQYEFDPKYDYMLIIEPVGGSGNVYYGLEDDVSTNYLYGHFQYYDGSWHVTSYDLQFQFGFSPGPKVGLRGEFSGFGKATTTDQGGYQTVTYFHQGGGFDGSELGEYEDSFAKRGRPFRQEVYDDSNNLLTQTIYKWDENATFADPTFAATSTFVYKTQETASVFNDSGQHQDTVKLYDYDTDTGNLLTVTDLGEVTANVQTGAYTDVTGDSKETNYEYALNETKHILSAVKTKTIEDPDTAEELQQNYYYDGSGTLGYVDEYNLTKEDLPDQTIDYEYTYNDYGLVTAKEDPYANETTYTYDDNNLYPFSITNPLSQVSYSDNNYLTGEVATTTNPNGLKVQKIFDSLGRVTELKKTDPDNAPSMITLETYTYYDTADPWYIKKVSYVDASNSVDTYTYFDGLGRTIQQRVETENSGIYTVVSYQYDARGNLVKQSLPYFESGSSYQAPTWANVPKKVYTYDALNRVLTIVDDIGTTAYDYDLWTTTITDANGNDKDLTTDAYNRLVEVKEYNDGSSYTTTYDYNYLDKLTNITDSQSNERNFIYDDLGRLTSQEEMHTSASQNFGVWEYEYDLNSNLTEITDPRDEVITFTYDDLNRVLTEDAATTTGITDISYTYDSGTNSIGRLTSADKNTPLTSYTDYEYDLWGRVISETKDVKDRQFETEYTYNWADQPLTITYPDDFQARYVYDSVGQAEEVYIRENGGQEEQIIDSVKYTPLGQMTIINYANGTIATSTYDSTQNYRLTKKQISTTTPAVEANWFQNLIYDYDDVGNITEIVETAPNQLAKTATFGYDDLYRLTSASITDYQSSQENLTFAYDEIGNITSKTGVGNYTYGNDNPYQASIINSVNYIYDDNGNLINDGTRAMYYDYKDRMIDVTILANNRKTAYYYDHTKQRIVKQDAQTNAYRVYPNKYYEKTSSGIEDRYVYLGNLRILTDEKISQTASLYYNFSDHLNSSSITLDSNGNYVNLADYYPFGSARINIQPGAYNPTYKFTDQEYDSESGIYYFGARFYDQRIGRFVQSDPLSLSLANEGELKNLTGNGQKHLLSNPQNLNYYSYAGNNPIIYIDPDGNVRWSFGSMLSNTYNAFKNYGGLITECIDAYRANANYQAVEKTKQYYNDYNNLSDQDKQSIFTNTREAYAQTQINMELSENAVLGMVGGGYASKYGNTIAQKMVSIESKFLREGLKATEHTIYRTATRESRGITAEKVIDTIKTGKKYYDTLYKNYSYFKDGIRVAEDLAGNLRTVVTQNSINLERFIEIIK